MRSADLGTSCSLEVARKAEIFKAHDAPGSAECTRHEKQTGINELKKIDVRTLGGTSVLWLDSGHFHAF